METTTETREHNLLGTISKKLIQAHQEIDELAVQLALGKAEAMDKFEEIKSDFRRQVAELKKLMASSDRQAVTNIGKLEFQLDLGKVKTADAFEIQKEKILNALAIVARNVTSSGFFHHEAEKFKLKLIILQLSFALKKLQIKDDFKQRMVDAKDRIEAVKNRIQNTLKTGKVKYLDFRAEIDQAYSHLKNAIEKL